jgi:hypothetical protein
MKPTSDLSNKTKAELTALARRKKIPVTSGMLKNELIKAIKKGLRKIEAQKKSRTATVKTRKRTPASKTAKKISKKKSPKTSKAKTARKPKATSRKTASTKRKQTPVKKKSMRKKSPAKGEVKKAPAKKSAARKPKTARSPKKVKSQARSKPVETLSDLPERYGDHRLVVLARDPNWAYAYWDLNPTQVRNLLKSAGQTADKARWILRVYSAALQPVEEKGHYFDVDIDVEAGNYYLNLSRPGARFIVEIGVIDASGLFRSTAQSNSVILPLDHPSDTLAQESTFSEDTTSPSAFSFTKPPPSRSQ